MSGVPKPRSTASLAKSLDQRLNLYTLAARANCRLTYAAAVTAAGSAVMSLAPPAEAKIIYTPAHIPIPPNSHGILIDFNYQPNGGEGDFRFARSTGCSYSRCVSGFGVRSYGNRSNAIAATVGMGYAVALRSGERMGLIGG